MGAPPEALTAMVPLSVSESLKKSRKWSRCSYPTAAGGSPCTDYFVDGGLGAK
jgi:hypothetical protein